MRRRRCCDMGARGVGWRQRQRGSGPTASRLHTAHAGSVHGGCVTSMPKEQPGAIEVPWKRRCSLPTAFLYASYRAKTAALLRT